MGSNPLRQTAIEPGTPSDISRAEGNWIFLDVGFSHSSRSCGVLFGEETPRCLQFGEATREILDRLRGARSLMNLVVEAPLSVCFDSRGNPKGRSLERHGGKTRYWYNGLGCAVMVAAMYLVREIHQAGCTARLFEGFVSYKDGSVPSSHMNDVLMLREIVRDPAKFSENIYSAERLKLDPSDKLKSAFAVAGIDCGIPAVIAR